MPAPLPGLSMGNDEKFALDRALDASIRLGGMSLGALTFNVSDRIDGYFPTLSVDTILFGGSQPLAGQLMIGNGTKFNLATLTAGSGVAIDNSVPGFITIAATGAELSVGTFSSAPVSNGLIISTGQLSLHAADATNPGAISTSAQSFAGLKTFNNGLAGALSGNVTGNLTGNVTGNLTGNVAGNVIGNVTASPTANLLLTGRQVDSVSAIGTTINTSLSYSTVGSKLLSAQNNGTEEWFVRFDGSTPDSLFLINVKNYGALGNNTNDYAAVQAALDAVPSSGGAVYFPRGHYRNDTKDWRIKIPYTKIFGEGYGSLIESSFDGDIFLEVGLQDALPLVAPLNPAGIGHAINFTGSNDKWINLSRNIPCASLNGKTGFDVRFWVNPHSISDSFSIIQSCGNLSTSNGISSGPISQAFRVYNQGGGDIICVLRTTSGGDHTIGIGSPSINTQAEVEFSWDGTNLKGFLDGALINSTPCTGSIVQKSWEDIVVGPYFLGYQQTNLGGPDANAVIDQLQLCDAAIHTSAFTPPTSHAVNGNTLALLDFLTGEYDDALIKVKNKNGASYNQFYQESSQAHGVQGVEVSDLRLQPSNHAIEGWIATDSKFKNLRIEGAQGFGIHLRNNSYNSTIENIYATSGGVQNQPLICLQGASGASKYSNIKTLGGKAGVLLDNSGGEFNHCYCVAGSITNVWFKDSQIAGHSLLCTDENGSGSQLASMIFDGAAQGVFGTFIGCDFEIDTATCPTVLIDVAPSPANMVPKSTALNFLGTRFANVNYSTSHIKTYGTWTPGRVSIIDCFNVQAGTTPYTDSPLTTFIIEDGSPFVSAPMTAGAAGYPGQIAYDSGFFYVCTATNTWLRTALATWP